MADTKPVLEHDGSRIYRASTLALPLPDASVHAVVTSPPYWGLRNYQGEQRVDWASGEPVPFGQETTHDCTGRHCGDCYVCHSIEILRELRRVLRPDGVLFWNLGDTYWHSGLLREGRSPDDLKEKDLCLMPFRVALAAQADGWWVRSVITWRKTNPVPRAVVGRPKDVHDHIIVLTPSRSSYWDEEGFRFGRDRNREPVIETVWSFATQRYKGAHFATFAEELPRRCIPGGHQRPWLLPAVWRSVAADSGHLL